MSLSLGVDWAPAAELLALAALLAAAPVVWVWRRTGGQQPRQRMLRLASITLFICFDLVVFGAFTRLTDSGLGCPDWPGCYGTSSPFAAAAPIADAQSAMPTGPVTQVKAWIEMVHRYIAMVVGALIVLQLALAWRWRRHGLSVLAPLGLLLWILLQGAFGAWTVTFKLQPIIVTGHLLGGMVLLALLQAYRGQLRGHSPVPMRAGQPSAWVLGSLLVLLFMQIALGAWVSTNYAVLACQDFPTCHGGWWPDMNWRAGFELWRPLGMSGHGEPIPANALVAIHWAHRLMAVLVGGALWVAAWRWRRIWPRWCAVLAGLVGLQIATGVSNVVLQWPLVAALAHTAGAGALVMHLVAAWSAVRRKRQWS